ncbi:MAG: hypothetical protein N4A72_06230 [Bacteroidales bacterium]|jgi:hypothetical protein|nr:hypothetical protein [Bacteroidales bacterium]
MVRLTEEIQKEQIKEAKKLLPQLQESKHADWVLWTHAVSNSIHLFEQHIANDKNFIESTVKQKRYGHVPWYVNLAYEFKLGYDLRFNKVTGELEYLQFQSFPEGTDISPIKRVSVSENASTRRLVVKVATEIDGELSVVPDDILLSFKNYMEKGKVAGTDIDVKSLPGDYILLGADVYYNPLFSLDTVKENLKASMNKFRTEFNFYGEFVRNELLRVMRATEGVNDVLITDIKGKQGDNITDITREYEVISGYFNYKPVDLSESPVIETFNYIADE